MQSTSKYSELYLKKHQNPSQSQKNETYVQFLETQLDKTSAAINLTQCWDQRMTELESQNVVLREKLADITKYVKLFQKFAEIQVIDREKEEKVEKRREKEEKGIFWGYLVNFFKEEENQNIKDVLTELKGGIDPTANQNQMEIIKATLSQQQLLFENEINEKLIKNYKAQDHKIQIFSERIQGVVQNKVQNFGGLQDLVEDRMNDFRKELNSKINCVFQEIQENVTQHDLQQFVEEQQKMENKRVQQIQEIEERINQKQLFLNDLTEELLTKFQQKTDELNKYESNDSLKKYFNEYKKQTDKEIQKQKIQFNELEAYIEQKITISFDKLSEMFTLYAKQDKVKQNNSLVQSNKQLNSSKKFELHDISISNDNIEQSKNYLQDLDISSSSLSLDESKQGKQTNLQKQSEKHISDQVAKTLKKTNQLKKDKLLSSNKKQKSIDSKKPIKAEKEVKQPKQFK